MPGDPQECRQHALTCMQMAEHAAIPGVRQSFLNLSNTWIRLAAELESAQGLLKALNGAEFDRSEIGSLLLPGDNADPRLP